MPRPPPVTSATRPCSSVSMVAFLAEPLARRSSMWATVLDRRQTQAVAADHADEGHHHGHDHSHGSIRAGERHRGRLALAFAVLATFMVVEVVGGLVTNSLALLS